MTKLTKENLQVELEDLKSYFDYQIDKPIGDVKLMSYFNVINQNISSWEELRTFFDLYKRQVTNGGFVIKSNIRNDFPTPADLHKFYYHCLKTGLFVTKKQSQKEREKMMDLSKRVKLDKLPTFNDLDIYNRIKTIAFHFAYLPKNKEVDDAFEKLNAEQKRAVEQRVEIIKRNKGKMDSYLSSLVASKQLDLNIEDTEFVPLKEEQIKRIADILDDITLSSDEKRDAIDKIRADFSDE